jgi:cob(I)alamin adenosyltransferase
MKLDKIYTRTGDEGKTSLGDGTRLAKFDLRVTAYGEIDEANSALGVAMLHIQDAEVRAALLHIQNDLFDLGADLCRPSSIGTASQPLRVTPAQVLWLEQTIDRFNAPLAPLTTFVLPGGTPAASYLHLARTITRRAERSVVKLADRQPDSVNPAVLRYVNRLSDLLFVLARYSNHAGKSDVLWTPGLHR